MTVQPKPYNVGDLVRVRSCRGGYPLPDGLPERALVTVASETDHGYLTVRRHGRPFRVYLANIDSG